VLVGAVCGGVGVVGVEFYVGDVVVAGGCCGWWSAIGVDNCKDEC